MSKPILPRLLNLDLPQGQSAFLWGARGAGKSTYLRSKFPKALYYDLLKTDQLTLFLAQPHLLREELIGISKEQKRYPVIIDEIQKIPLLLNEVHWLIENEGIGFILCWSSARKLKRGAANLLGGRAWRFTFYPLVYKEIKEYYQILVDTLIGYLITPFHKKISRDLIETTPKFYLFDVGVANYLKRTEIVALKGSEAGKSFESFILMEIVAYLGLNEIDIPIKYWRSKSGLKVDFILKNGKIAIEIKIAENPAPSDLKGIIAFATDYNPEHAIVVCPAARSRQIRTPDGKVIKILPWKTFIDNLWNKEYI